MCWNQLKLTECQWKLGSMGIGRVGNGRFPLGSIEIDRVSMEIDLAQWELAVDRPISIGFNRNWLVSAEIVLELFRSNRNFSGDWKIWIVSVEIENLNENLKI